MSDLELNYIPRAEHERIVAELRAQVPDPKAVIAQNITVDAIAREDHDAIVSTLEEENNRLRAHIDQLRGELTSWVSDPAPTNSEPTESEGAEA